MAASPATVFYGSSVELSGKNILITGAASGIGRALAVRFAQDGPASLTLLDLHQPPAQDLAQELASDSLEVMALGVDVADETQISAAVTEAESQFGPLDLVCSNAGISVAGGAGVPTDDWQRIWDVNVMAHVHMARAVLPSMIERGSGYLLNTASAAGLLTQIGSAPYAVTKAGAVSFGEWLAVTHGHQGIKVSILCPQAVNTPMIAGMDRGGVAGVDGVIEPEELADVVVDGIGEERFLILPHPQVAEYVRRKGDDYERWITGMQRLQQRFPNDELGI